MAVILDPCSLAAFSRKALKTWVDIFFGSKSSKISSSSGSNSYKVFSASFSIGNFSAGIICWAWGIWVITFLKLL